MNRRPIVLIFLRWYLPGYKSGGPVRSVANFVDELGDKFDFRIVTSDRDSLDKEPYQDILVDGWNTIGKATVYYASPKTLSLTGVSKLIKATRYDTLYLNSFFDLTFTGIPVLYCKFFSEKRIPIIISQRGEFSSGALEIFPFKKMLFIKLVIFLGLCKDFIWHATSDLESEDIKRIVGVGEDKIVVARNLPEKANILGVSSNNKKYNLNKEPIRLVFLSRISFKKNLDYALSILEKIKIPLIFDIYGVIDDDKYWNACQKKISHMPANIIVEYKGAVPHEDVISVLSTYDLFFFPTQGENYGHVIAEAMIAGLPVLISDQTPWSDIENLGVGFVKKLEDRDGFIDTIQKFSVMSDIDRWKLSDRIIYYVQNTVTNKRDIDAHSQLFTLSIDKLRARN